MEGHIGTQRGTAAHEDALVFLAEEDIAADPRLGMYESYLAYVAVATGLRADDSRADT